MGKLASMRQAEHILFMGFSRVLRYHLALNRMNERCLFLSPGMMLDKHRVQGISISVGGRGFRQTPRYLPSALTEIHFLLQE